MLDGLTTLTAASALMLVLAYGIGAPFLLLRAVLTLGKRRRLRYRAKNDDVLATSRFTIPVSLIVPVDAGAADASRRVRQLLQFRYPELEIIVVVPEGSALEELKQSWSLAAAEVFYRKSLSGAPVRGLYRSLDDLRVIVVHAERSAQGAALNSGINLARYRYIAAVDVMANYNADALLEAMQAALDDPQRVVGATTSLAVEFSGADGDASGQSAIGLARALRFLTAARARLATVARRRLDLPPDGCPGFTIWRRDAVVDVGGFNPTERAVQADMTFRLHAHFAGDHRRYRIIHVAEPVGGVPAEEAERLVRAARVPARLLWRHKPLLFNPRLGRLGLFDLPRYAFNLLVAPWLELVALAMLVLAVPLGVLTPAELLVVLLTVGLGSGVLAAAALLVSGMSGRDPRPAALLGLLVVGPFEYFATRPALLIDRFRR
jgi:cellulose synthase/poly-beta-1,6-N-acetylglucosamine synthase-like glycosyltransferase